VFTIKNAPINSLTYFVDQTLLELAKNSEMPRVGLCTYACLDI